ncbi:MAG: hypothetical protein KUA43_22960 [Hoeflea sp.]|uniref:hypothetical protein n=1 Tax=Hoeflea sp. TaxID=1940281 RepID=UPI001E126739|nr:hypothetical protein [Hoeflea sp.]MBU4530792.1 hypothetical protein [Alphaproteobacteria bacterium]MBU4545364.1 hypothetical protein [Alphaproteobacteria bacterium]MBU4549414.1 hypothetical protein [Alphaproteobacteria bacterium]MBV1726306.1 hypothetical protein [Hoeflea sp.]MBV1761874.1 hypothetical protein [Hoeflea sp.]
MPGPWWMGVALALLAGAVGMGEWLLARRCGSERRVAAERIVLLTLAGGFLGAPFWWRGDPDAFAWILPPLAGRMLAAAGWAFAVACLIALLRPGAAQFRLIGVMLATYLGPLTAAILSLHLNRFDPARPVTWGFFVIVLLLLAGSVWLLRPDPGLPPEAALPETPQTAAQPMAAVFGIAAAIWGIALFIWPSGPAAYLWLWPTDALTSRLIASMFLTIAAAVWASRGSSRVRETVMASILVYGVGACLAGAANWAAGKPLPVAYMAFWTLGGAGAAAFLLMRRSRPGYPA